MAPPDSQRWPPLVHENELEEMEATNQDEHSTQKKTAEVVRTSDREELIECIKKGQRPEWVPKPTLKALCAEEEAAAQSNAQRSMPHGRTLQTAEDPATTAGGMEIPESKSTRRPPSALHAGDFMVAEASTRPTYSPAANGHNYADLGSYSPMQSGPGLEGEFARAISTPGRSQAFLPAAPRPRAPSLGSSLSSSFVLRTPTSPLVNAINYDNQTRTERPHEDTHRRNARRRTMPAEAFHAQGISFYDGSPPNFSRPLQTPALRREFSSPLQGHRPRLSLSSFTFQSISGPRSPGSPQLRRPSVPSELSRLPMVGSFEESILRGRMSTPASKPLEFMAQIGVLGKGDCQPSLKCPPHVSVPFSAVFYNYAASTATRSIVDDTPSPYVGTIDLENNLKPPCAPKRRRRQANASSEVPKSELAQGTASEKSSSRKPQPSLLQGGVYRVPQEGQLQIIIKNPNKTGVKLFLVPYDLQGMPVGSKTFVRQRSFSSGPILEVPISTNPGPSKMSDPLQDKNILRYLIHLKFCRTSRNRFYLHDCIRVVFANRVPDGKENLRNEIQLPEPRFSTYRPQDTTVKTPTASESFNGPVERRPPAFSMPAHFDVIDGIPEGLVHQRVENSPLVTAPSRPVDNTEGLGHESTGSSANPFVHTVSSQAKDATLLAKKAEAKHRALSPVPGFHPSTSRRSSPIPWPIDTQTSNAGRFSPLPVEAGDGLLSRQLREWSATGNRKDG